MASHWTELESWTDVDCMTIKQTIVDELLACTDGPELKQVMDKYRRSKGPLFAALAEATSRLRHRIAAAHEQATNVEARKDLLANQVIALARPI